MKPLRLTLGIKTTKVFARSAVGNTKNVDKSVGYHKMMSVEFFEEQTLYSSDFANAKENLINITKRHAE